MKNIKQYLISLTFIFAASVLCASSDGGRVALPFLKMDMGARYYGMAGAATAYGDDVTAMTFYNPAALGSVESFQLAGTIHESALDMKYSYAGLAFPVSFLSFFGTAPMSVAFSFYMYDKGDMDDNGIERTIGDDLSFTFSLGEMIGTHTWDLMGDSSDVYHYFGINGKYIRSTLPKPVSGDVTGDTFAFDAGYRMVVDNHFGIGLAVRNVGGKIKYIEEKDALPATVSAGLFFSLVDVNNVLWNVSGDYIRHIEEKQDRVRVGTELTLFDLLSIRGGARLMEEIEEEFTLGFGLKLFGFEADFGMVLNPQLNDDDVYQVSIAYKFPVKKRDTNYTESEKKRSDYKQYKEQETKQAQEKAERNINPILYQ